MTFSQRATEQRVIFLHGWRAHRSRMARTGIPIQINILNRGHLAGTFKMRWREREDYQQCVWDLYLMWYKVPFHFISFCWHCQGSLGYNESTLSYSLLVLWINNRISSDILKVMFYRHQMFHTAEAKPHQEEPLLLILSCMMVAYAAPAVLLPQMGALRFSIPLSLSTSARAHVCLAAPGSHLRLAKPLHSAQSDASTRNTFTYLSLYKKQYQRGTKWQKKAAFFLYRLILWQAEISRVKKIKWPSGEIHNNVLYRQQSLDQRAEWIEAMMDIHYLEFESCLWPLHSFILWTPHALYVQKDIDV